MYPPVSAAFCAGAAAGGAAGGGTGACVAWVSGPAAGARAVWAASPEAVRALTVERATGEVACHSYRTGTWEFSC